MPAMKARPRTAVSLVERLRASVHHDVRVRSATSAEAADEIERLRAVIIRAKDALLDGQSTQYVHDMLVTALVGPKP
jgi:hypothetical protein